MQRWLVVSMALAACGGSHTMAEDDQPAIDAAAGGGTEPAALAGITAAHNQVRAMVDTTGVTGGALAPLAWDDSLAQTAAAWVAKCQDADGNGLVDHNDGRSDGHPYYVGENIYASSGTATGGDAVAAWAGEAASYHYASNACDAGAGCGHYTQLVWRTTQLVGCARGSCPGLAFPSTIVCDYGPGGNVNNQRPY